MRKSDLAQSYKKREGSRHLRASLNGSSTINFLCHTANASISASFLSIVQYHALPRFFLYGYF